MRTNNQSGISTFVALGALVGLGVVFIVIFILVGGSKKPSTTATDQNQNQTANPTTTPTIKEPPFIRIPENSMIYTGGDYKFMFAYPATFGALTASVTADPIVSSYESALASQKPIGGSSAAFLNGRFGVYVYKKDDFKVVVTTPSFTVAPTKTGNDTTWKVVSTNPTDQSTKVGNAYQVQTVKSQTGVPVFNFTLKTSTSVFARWVFEAGDNYVVVVMPTISRPSGAALTEQDVAAYTVIGTNIAKTTRVTSNSFSSTGSTAVQSQTSSTTQTTPSTTPSTTPGTDNDGFVKN